MPLAMVLTEPGRIEAQERARRALEPYEARVAVRVAGVCGTDLAIWSGGYRVPLPLVLGHEWAGQVIEVGAGGPANLAGRRVTAEINNTCYALGIEPHCDPAHRCLPTHCRARTVTGIVAWDGAFQREIIVPWRAIHVLPDDFSDEEGALIEPLAAALQTFELSPAGAGDFVVVLGAGRLGALIALVAKARGAQTIVTTRDLHRAEILREMGLEVFMIPCEQPGNKVGENKPFRVESPDPLAPASSPLLDLVLERTGGLGADLVAEATGAPEGLALAFDLVRPRGVVALKSTPGQPVRDFPLTRFVVNEIRIQGSRCGPFDKAIEFQLRHRLPLQRFIQGEFPLERLGEAFEAACNAPGKILVRVG